MEKYQTHGHQTQWEDIPATRKTAGMVRKMLLFTIPKHWKKLVDPFAHKINNILVCKPLALRAKRCRW